MKPLVFNIQTVSCLRNKCAEYVYVVLRITRCILFVRRIIGDIVEWIIDVTISIQSLVSHSPVTASEE